MLKNFYFRKVFSLILLCVFAMFLSFSQIYAALLAAPKPPAPLPSSPLPYTPNLGLGAFNIAIAKATASDGMSGSNGPYYGNDNDLNTYWSAKDNKPNHWWMVDLKYSYFISGYEVVWKENNVLYKYKIEVSTDKVKWDTVVDKTKNNIRTQVQGENFFAIGRYVRITITEVPKDRIPGFYEFRVFGTLDLASSPEVSATPTTTPTPTLLPTSTGTYTQTPTSIPTPKPTATSIQTITPTPTQTITPTPTQAMTPTPTQAITPTPTETITPAPTQVLTPIPPIATASSIVIPTSQSTVSLSRSTIDKVNYGSVADITLSQLGDISIPGTISGQKEIMLVIENSLASNTIYNQVTTALDYGLFAKNNIYSKGQNADINASVNANNTFVSNANNLNIRDVLSAGNFSITTPQMDVEWYVNNIEPVEMPSFHEKLIEDAKANSMVFDPADYIIPKPLPGQENFIVTYAPYSNTFFITGSGRLEIKSSMYFKGNLKISVTNTINKDSSFIVADGSIDIQGVDFRPDSEDDILNLYSIHGNIRISTSNSTLRGIMYSAGITGNPLYTYNVGDVIIEGSKNTIIGAIISGNDIEVKGQDTVINYPEHGFSREKSEYYEIENRNINFKIIAKQFIDSFVGTDTKLGVIQYSDSANDNSFVLYDLSNPSEVSLLQNEIENMEINETAQNNMGDGLRQAYHTLKNLPESDASRYIVNIGFTAPNKWTAQNDLESEYKVDGGNADYVSGDGIYDADGKGLAYAKTVANLISTGEIEPIFIHYSNNSSYLDKFEEISLSAGVKALPDGKHFYTVPYKIDLIIVADGVSKKPPKNIVLDNVVYEEIYPLGVKVVKVPSGMTVTEVTDNGKTRYKVSGKLDSIKLTYDGSKYILSPYSFDVTVRYTSIGKIKYSGTDSKLTYSFDYIDINGCNCTWILEENFKDMDVNVIWTIDIS